MAPDDRLARGAAHETDEGDCRGAPKSCSNFAKIESFYHFEQLRDPLVLPRSGVEKSKKRTVFRRFGGKVLAGRFLPQGTERLLLGKRCSAYDTCSIEGSEGEVEEPGHGNREVEPKDFHRFRSCEPDGDLRGARAQLCQEPPPWIHRAGRGSRRNQCGSVAIYALGFDGSCDPLSEVHTLSARRRQEFEWLPGPAGEPFLLLDTPKPRVATREGRGYARSRGKPGWFLCIALQKEDRWVPQGLSYWSVGLPFL